MRSLLSSAVPKLTKPLCNENDQERCKRNTAAPHSTTSTESFALQSTAVMIGVLVFAVLRRLSVVLGKTHLIKTWLVDGQGVAVPGINTSLVDVHNNYLDVGALVGDHRHRGAAHIPAHNHRTC